jgi:hypothetical protein
LDDFTRQGEWIWRLRRLYLRADSGWSPPIWCVLPKGRSDILCLVAAELQTRQAEVVAEHPGLHKRTARTRVEAYFARMLAFDFEPGVKEWRRSCAAQGWYWTRQQAVSLGDLAKPSELIERDLGPVIAAVWALYESAVKDACVMDWALDEATMVLTARPQVISLGHQKRGCGC